MTVLITVRNGQQMLGRCDATCYNAKGDRCRCICGGINHGVGELQAQYNLVDLPSVLEARILKRFPQTTTINFHHPLQVSLFHAPQPNPHTLPHEAA